MFVSAVVRCVGVIACPEKCRMILDTKSHSTKSTQIRTAYQSESNIPKEGVAIIKRSFIKQ